MSADNLLLIIHDRFGLFYKRELIESFFDNSDYGLDRITYDGELILIRYSDRPKFGAQAPFDLCSAIQSWIYNKKLSTCDGITELEIFYNDEQEGQLKKHDFENTYNGVVKRKIEEINNLKSKIKLKQDKINSESNQLNKLKEELNDVNRD